MITHMYVWYIIMIACVMIILKQMLSMGMCAGVLQYRSSQYTYTAIPAHGEKWDRYN